MHFDETVFAASIGLRSSSPGVGRVAQPVVIEDVWRELVSEDKNSDLVRYSEVGDTLYQRLEGVFQARHQHGNPYHPTLYPAK